MELYGSVVEFVCGVCVCVLAIVFTVFICFWLGLTVKGMFDDYKRDKKIIKENLDIHD